MQGISSISKKISFDLKKNNSLILNNNANISGTSNSIKPGIDSNSIQFMNFQSTANPNKISIGNSTVNSENSMHKQLNYQILKTISNKNTSTTSNLLSPSSNNIGGSSANNSIGNSGVNLNFSISNNSNSYSNIQEFKGK